MILDESLFQDYRKPLKESKPINEDSIDLEIAMPKSEDSYRFAVSKRIVLNRFDNAKVIKNDDDILTFESGEIYVEMRRIDKRHFSLKVYHNSMSTAKERTFDNYANDLSFQVSTFAKSINKSKSINEGIDGTLNKLGGPVTFRRELIATIDAYPGIEDDIEELVDMMYGSYKDAISIEELESAIEYMIYDVLESTEAVNSSYSPELLNDLVNYYSSFDTMSYEEIWDEIVVKYHNKGLANDVIESLDSDEEDYEDEFLDESLSSLSDDQLDKAMELVDEIYEACKSIYSYNENGKFEEGLNLNEWSIYAAAADLHDIVERGSLTESTETDETPWSYKEVEDALKSLSNNWKDKSGVCRCWYKEEKQHAVKILRKHYKIVETSQDGDWTVIAFETPI